MEQPNNEKKQNDGIVPQGTNEIESLNDSQELDLEQLEEIAGGGWGCNNKIKIKECTSKGWGRRG